MGIAASNSVTLSDNGQSDWVYLHRGANVISVASPTWGGSTAAAIEQSDDGTDDTKSAVEIKEGEALSLTGNKRFILEGPGYVAMTVANYSGSQPITLKRISPL